MVARRKRPRRPKASAGKPKLRVRMYRQGLGDCFLVSFLGSAHPAHMLIDFGSIGEKTTGVTLDQVAADIVAETGGRLSTLVATHEHQDHVNGFLKHGKKAFGEPGFTVDRVWLAWTEDGSDPLAQQLEKYRHDLLRGIAAGANALAAAGKAGGDGLGKVRSALAFLTDASPTLGAKGLAKTVDEAMTWVTTRADNGDKYLQPGMVMEPAWAPGFRFYVLGPPRDERAINTLGTHGDDDLYEMGARVGSDMEYCAGLVGDQRDYLEYRDSLDARGRGELKRRLPFDPLFRIEASDSARLAKLYAGYADPGDAWRRIDLDWLRGASDLALQLDNSTNNTSLVLAIESIEDGRVLLFPGDAQKGNWTSWHAYDFEVEEGGRKRIVKAKDLLARTVFYKVGHHSSHNATLKGQGLELMQRKDLVAFIPLDAATASNKWPTADWPAAALYAALVARTRGRVVRSDTGWPVDGDRPAATTKAEWVAAREEVVAGKVVEVAPGHVDYWLR